MSATNFYKRLWAGLTLGCERAIGWSRRASTAFARPSVLVALLMVLVPVCVMMLKPAAKASGSIIVNTTADSISADGFCSLREAITNANNAAQTYTDCADPGGTTATITFDDSIAGGTITLVGSTLPTIAHTLTIDGTGQNITVDGANTYQVFQNTGTLTVNDLTIAHGNSGSDGGGVYNHGGTLSVINSTFSANSSGNVGGGIGADSGATTTVLNGTFSGNSASTNAGGGIFNYINCTLTVSNSTFFGNTAGLYGGGVFNAAGTLAVTNSTFSGNSAPEGGGIHNYNGSTEVTNSTFSGNSAGEGVSVGAGGGGIFNTGGTLTVLNSTFSGNSALVDGGGIFNYSGTLSVINGTFSGNSANAKVGAGGGILNQNGRTEVTNSTFSGNSAGAGAGIDGGGGIFNTGGTATVTNSILATSTGNNCAGITIFNGGYNISDDASCLFGSSTGANGQHIGDNVIPKLSSTGLQNNGGPTKTIALQSNSPAIDAIPIADCPYEDQRGAPRPDPEDIGSLNPACDIGAFEFGNVLPTPSSCVTLRPSTLDFGTVKVGQSSAASTFTLSNGCVQKLTLNGTAIGLDFRVGGTTCTSALKPGKSCNYMVSFRPQSVGTKSEVFRVWDVIKNQRSQPVQLHGIGQR